MKAAVSADFRIKKGHFWKGNSKFCVLSLSISLNVIVNYLSMAPGGAPAYIRGGRISERLVRINPEK